MNTEKLLELSDTLRGLAQGKEWEWRQYDDDAWQGKMDGDCPITALAFGRNIRLKPQPDPYAELKAAHASGKTIQCNANSGTTWIDLPKPYFGASVENYRIKPEPQKLPLCADDVKAGAQFLSKCGQVWFPNHIREGYVCFGHFMSLTFQELVDDEWKIRCAGETEWRPCYKLVEQ